MSPHFLSRSSGCSAVSLGKGVEVGAVLFRIDWLRIKTAPTIALELLQGEKAYSQKVFI